MPSGNIVPQLHLVLLALWGGVVATEAVMEVLGRRRRRVGLVTPAGRLP